MSSLENQQWVSIYSILKGSRLNLHDISLHNTASSAQCAILCTSVPECVSADYKPSESLCTMKNATDEQYPADLNEDNDYLFIRLNFKPVSCPWNWFVTFGIFYIAAGCLYLMVTHI